MPDTSEVWSTVCEGNTLIVLGPRELSVTWYRQLIVYSERYARYPENLQWEQLPSLNTFSSATLGLFFAFAGFLSTKPFLGIASQDNIDPLVQVQEKSNHFAVSHRVATGKSERGRKCSRLMLRKVHKVPARCHFQDQFYHSPFFPPKASLTVCFAFRCLLLCQ